jgi:hypothetical protein
MSRVFFEEVLGYLAQSRKAAPATLLALASGLHSAQLHGLPVGIVFEPLRTPIHNIESAHQLFSVPEEDRFYTCLISGGNVLCASALRERYYAAVVDSALPTGLAWLLVDGYSGRLCALLHAERNPGSLNLLALYVATDDLETLLHERLLLLLVAFADTRGLEIESRVPKDAVPMLLWALLGFMWHPQRELLIRPAVREMVNSYELLSAVDQQILRVTGEQRMLLEAAARISPETMKNTVGATGTPTVNSVESCRTP